MNRGCAAIALGFAALVLGCDNAGRGRVLSVDASGIVKGLVYLDRNGNRQPDGADTVLAGVRVRLIASGTSDTTVSVLTDATGSFRVAAVPIGSYVVSLDTATIGDSIDVVRLSATQVVVRPADSLTVTATVSFPLLTVRAARLLPAGRKVFVEGVVLSPRGVFGDTTLHVADTSQAIRLTRPRATPGVGVGDSVRFLGITGRRDGQPTLDDAVVLPLASAGIPVPLIVTTAVARTAGSGGVLDAALVFIDSVTIVDTATVPGTGSTPPPTLDYRLTVDPTPADTAGRLDVLLDGHAGFQGIFLAPFRPDSIISLTGVLVPAASGGWRLKPRFPFDAIVH